MATYNLTFSGEIIDDFTIEKVKSNFKKKFNLSEIQLKQIFSGKTIILKKDLSQQNALLLATAIDEIGGIAYIEANNESIQLPPGIKKDRRVNRRRLRMHDRRNHHRSGIYCDRRNTTDRRKSPQ